MIPEITIKISFAEAPGAGGAAAVLPSSSGVEIAPPTLGGDPAADMIPAPPEVGAETAAVAGFDVPPPPAAAGAEDEYLQPPGAEDEPYGDLTEDDAPPPSPVRGGKRGR